jgi:hypothetical protein
VETEHVWSQLILFVEQVNPERGMLTQKISDRLSNRPAGHLDLTNCAHRRLKEARQPHHRSGHQAISTARMRGNEIEI